MTVDVEQIDPHNEPALKAWWEVGRDSTAERPGTPWPAWEVTRRTLPAHDPERVVVILAAIDDREMVGAAMVKLPQRSNLHLAEVDVQVRPSRRREGIATALLAEAERLAAGAGRRTVVAEGFVPPDGAGPASSFAAATGFAVAHRESIKELRRDDYVARRDALRARVGDAADDYLVVTFDTACPEEHLTSFGRLISSLSSQVPLGELELERSTWSPDRIRSAEERLRRIGRHALTALAIAPDGSVVGSSDVRVDDADPTSGQVGVTIVDPGHRGRRLGLVLKLATHDLALASYPLLETVTTSNAKVNLHMNAVNEVLGYRTIETLLELQKHL